MYVPTTPHPPPHQLGALAGDEEHDLDNLPPLRCAQEYLGGLEHFPPTCWEAAPPHTGRG